MSPPPGPGGSSMRMRSGRNVAAIAACASSQSDVRAAGNRSNGSAAMLAFCRPAAVIPQHPPTTSQVKPTTSQVNRCVSTQGSGSSAVPTRRPRRSSRRWLCGSRPGRIGAMPSPGSAGGCRGSRAAGRGVVAASGRLDVVRHSSSGGSHHSAAQLGAAPREDAMTSRIANEPTTAPAPAVPPFAQLYQLTTGSWVTQAMAVAARLGVADAIASGASTTTEIAQQVRADAPTLYRLLRALSDHGVFAEGPAGRFALTPVGESLRSDSPHSMRRRADLDRRVLLSRRVVRPRAGRANGEPSFARVHGTDLFGYLDAHPDDAAVFDGAMQDIAGNFLAGILTVYDFAGYSTVVDIGGGTG